jgi:hypothetical protein
MKLNEKVSEALLELAGTRRAVTALLDDAIHKLEADLLSSPCDADLLLAARLKLEGAKALRAHVSKLMSPSDR